MKNAARVIFLIVGALMIASAIIDFVNSVRGILSAGGWVQLVQSLKHLDDPSLRQYFQYFTGIIKAIGLAIIAASSIYGGIKGSGSFYFVILVSLMTGLFIFDIVGKAVSGGFTNDRLIINIIQMIIDSLAIGGYIYAYILSKLKTEKAT